MRRDECAGLNLPTLKPNPEPANGSHMPEFAL